MGNQLQLCKTTNICQQAHININQVEIESKKYLGPQSSQQLKQKILKYIDQNRLYLYPKRQKRIFQTLVSIGQQKLANQGIQLIREKVNKLNQDNHKNNNWDKFIQDVENMKVQDLDGFFQQFKLQQIFDRKRKNTQNQIQQKIKINKLHQQNLLKIEDKKLLKKKSQYYIKGNQILQNNQLLLIAPVECFSGIGALRNKTNLPSQATLLQMFISKVKAVNRRRNCSLGIIFIVNQQFIREFDKQIDNIKGLLKANVYRKLQIDQIFPQYQSEQDYHKLISYSVFGYKSLWPLFDQEYNIEFNQLTKQVQFNYQTGDLLKYIQTNQQITGIIQHYDYIQFTNINNMLSQIADSSLLGYMEDNQQVDITVKLIKPSLMKDNKQFQLSQFIRLDEKGFVEIRERQNIKNDIIIRSSEVNNNNDKNMDKNMEKKYYKNQPFMNIEEYYIKSRLILNQPEPLKRLLLSRIKKQVFNQFHEGSHSQQMNHELKNTKYFFRRQFSDLFYLKTTSFILVQEQNQYSHVHCNITSFKPEMIKNGHIGYSLYCKKIIGLKHKQINSIQEQQLVDIDAGILHKGYEEIVRLVDKLKTIQQIGFPIILYSDQCNSK